MPANSTILIIDDSLDNLKFLTEILNSENYVISTADSDKPALEYAHTLQPDLILLDICSPQIDGFELIRLLKYDQETADIPIIFITCPEDSVNKVKGFQEGAVDYITKPFDALDVLIRVKTHLELGCLRKKMQNDITKSKMTEFELRRTLENSRAMLELNPDLIFVFDSTGVYLECHTASPELLFLPENELIGSNIKEILPQEIADLLYSAFQKALSESGIQVVEYKILIKDCVNFFEAKIIKLGDDKLMAVIRDISNRKLIEQLHHVNSVILAELNTPGDFETTISNILLVLKEQFDLDATGIRFKSLDDFPYFAQHGFQNNFLLMENSLLTKNEDGKTCLDDNGKPSLECTCGSVLMGKTDPKYPFFTERGSFWTNNSFSLLDVPLDIDPRTNPRNTCIHHSYASFALIPIRSHKKIIGLLQLNSKKLNHFNIEMITFFEGLCESIGIAFQRKQAEETLRQSEELYRAITENTTDFIIRFGRDYRYIFGNSAAQSVVGLYNENFTGKTHAELGFPPHLCELFDRQIEKVFQTGIPESFEFEVELLDRERVLDLNLFPEFSPAGKIISVIGICRDITARKKAELEWMEIQKQLLHSQKMESIGILAGGIAHDFNNLLTVVLGNLDYLDYFEIENPEIIRHLAHAKDGLIRAAHLTRQLMAYAGHTFYELKELDVNSQLKHYQKQLKTLISPEIHFSMNLCNETTSIKGDRNHLDQVIIHLLTNSSEAIGTNQGEIIVTTGIRDYSSLELKKTRIPYQPDPGRFVFIEVKDNGCGMDETTLSKVFEPFFTTKFTGRGLGMASVQGILIAHHGAILIKTAVNQGTTVTVLLPLLQSAGHPMLNASPKTTTGSKVSQFTGTLIVADDEEMVLEMNAVVLRKLGFEVLTAVNGLEAVRLFKSHKEKITGVILDLAMPEMDGLSAAKLIKEIHSKVKIIIISGYDPSDEAFKSAIEITDGFVQKPFNMQQLKEALTSVFDNSVTQ